MSSFVSSIHLSGNDYEECLAINVSRIGDDAGAKQTDTCFPATGGCRAIQSGYYPGLKFKLGRYLRFALL